MSKIGICIISVLVGVIIGLTIMHFIWVKACAEVVKEYKDSETYIMSIKKN